MLGMFGVVAKTTIQIDSIKVNSPHTGMIHFEVYKTNGSLQGKEKTSDEWSLIATTRVEGGGESMPTTITSDAFSEDLIIPRRQSIGLYVTMKYQNELRYSPVQVASGDVFAENSDVAILVGTGNDYPFGNFYPKRMFNGALGYKKVASTPAPSSTPMPMGELHTSEPTKSHPTSPMPTAAPTLKPTPAPTSPPTLRPSPSPTVAPTVQALSLDTSWVGGIKNSGSMFDIVAKSDMRITSFVVNTPSTDIINFEIYLIPGGHRGNEQVLDKWTLVATCQVLGAGEGRRTVIGAQCFNRDIIILSQQTVGFYITMTRKTELRYTAVNDRSAGDVYTANLDLAILVGTGNDYPFGKYWPQRMFNGAIQYERLPESRVVDLAPALPGVPFTSITWNTEVSGVGNSRNGWSIRNSGFMARFVVEDSYTCAGGTSFKTQSGVAVSVISVPSQTPLYFDLRGMGEQFGTGYEMLTFEIDGDVVARATSAAKGKKCSSGPVVVTNTVPSPYYLSTGRHHLKLKFTTRDGYDHVGVYYELVLGFEP